MRRLLAASAAAAALLVSAATKAQGPGPLSGPQRPQGVPQAAPQPAGEDGPVLTPTVALATLQRENLRLAAARLELSATRADVISAGLLPNPTLSVSSNLLAHGALTGGANDIGVVVDQVIPLAGQVSLRQEAARALAGAAEREYAAEAWEIILAARLAYVDLQVAQARAAALGAALADLTRVEGIVGQRASAGANPQYDRLRVEVEKTNLTSRQADAAAGLQRARVALAQATGPHVDASTLHVAPEIVEPPVPTMAADALVTRALERRPEMAAAKLRVGASDAQVSYLRRRYVPSPDVAIGYTRAFGVPTATGSAAGGSFYAAVSIPLPLFDRGQGTIDRGRAEAEAARTGKHAAELTIRRETVRALEILRLRTTAWRTFRETSSASVERMRAIAELSYREGRATVLELLDAYASYHRMVEQGIELRGAAAKAAVELEHAVGPG